ncbi:segregation/condensation protein B [Clostridium botulinum]|uniref:Segregation and condensation protein B n=1 Tax=Clostridium botulinum C/D str. DC5 TaxID=1443128 RepID=A0A0A0IP27_CLOBO|nr:SMC-Scp complex subunit ScpB [Clostridium botulinum]KEI07077.1 segregation and condensation protein B [Clostridium botulinum C/D str. BKT75002]KEI12154.1 segregation and condensation protein B [Clostridium botulinum C/D str. BKT2873]KGM96839.1 segregation and condensation protein B [Clostridium botulinum D str. CCUG 7971]KGN01947.1 segregation and condensation protein B [Clostridium botulinum C/D str. DC5]KOC48584.1 segregation and condensation protein B [Clostridium botulinum]
MKKNNINQMEINEISMKNRHYGIIESLLFASGNPLDIKEIAHIIASSTEYTYNLLEDMKKNYNENSRGISLINMKEEYSLVTKPENSHYLQKLLKTNNRQALSRAALEALAIIVYKQPITRIEIDEIRGVKSDKAIQTLVEKEIIKEAGRKKVPGRPIMYATTGEFLKYFGLEDLNQMPTLSEFIEKDEEE